MTQAARHSHSLWLSDRRTLWFVFVITLVYSAAEFVGGMVSGSLALIADAGHMATDVASVALSLFATWVAMKPPTDQKTYGFHRAEILAALTNGASLVAVAILIAVEAWGRFRTPGVVDGKAMVFIASGGLAVNVICLWRLHQSSCKSLNLQAIWLHVVSDTLGSLSAIGAALLVWQFGWNRADSVISFFIVILILVGAIRLVVGCVDVLLESVPKGISLPGIRAGIKSIAQVIEVHDLHVWTVASGIYALSAHVSVAKGADCGEVLSAITTLLQQEHHIEHVTVQLEPPNYAHPPTHA